MKLTTIASLTRNGKLITLLILKHMFTGFYRLSFIASMAGGTLLEKLRRGPVRIEDLAGTSPNDTALRDAAAAWLELGVSLGVLKKHDEAYSLRGFLAKKLADAANDAPLALVSEVAGLHHLYITQTPEMLERGRLWDPAGPHREYGDIIARSSRSLEPFIFELIDRVFPDSGPVRLLEVGCGNAGYILHAAGRNAELRAVGLELDRHVAETAGRAVMEAGLQDRITIRTADVREYRGPGAFDVVTLYNNIYYFPVEERVALSAHLRDLLNPNGMIVITTGCMNGGIEFELVNLIHATTKGWGRLPHRDEMLRQLSEAGFERNSARNLLPGNGYYAFIGYKPALR